MLSSGRKNCYLSRHLRNRAQSPVNPGLFMLRIAVRPRRRRMSMIGEAIRTNIAEKYGLDQEDVQELYEAAQDSFTEGIRELEGAVTSSDMGQIKRGAHTFKGTLANMGL